MSFSFVFGKNPENLDFSSSKLADPELIGPDKLCNVFGSVIGDFFGAGDPLTDVYSWKIYSPSNQLIFDRSGGAGFQTISYTFSEIGTHRVELEVKRGASVIYSQTQNVELIKGPTILLAKNYEICGSGDLDLTAIDPSSPNFADYKFSWKNSSGVEIGTTNTITVSSQDTYFVDFYFEDALGVRDCESQLETTVAGVSDYTILQTSTQVCPDLLVNFKTSPSIEGTWYYEKIGIGTETYLSEGSSINIFPNQNLNGEGDYKIIFKPKATSSAGCLVDKSVNLTYFPQPEFFLVSTKGASDCKVYDGSLTIQAITPLDYVYLEGIGITTPPLAPGDTFTFTNLESGAYSMIGTLGSCTNSLGSVVSLTDPPEPLKYEIQDIEGELCTSDGKTNGSFNVIFTNGPIDGSYRLINEKGTEVQNVAFTGETSASIDIPGGRYYFELYSTDSCSLPKAELIEVPGLGQTEFIVPNELTICQSFELIPSTTQNIEFQLLFPDGTTELKNKDEPFIITEAGKYKIIGSNPTDPLICPTSKEFEVFLVDPVEFEPKLIKQDCFGNRTYFADINGRDPSTVVFSWYNENDELIGTGQNMFPTSIGEFKLDVQPANSAACPIPPKTFLIEEPILEVDVTLTSTKLCELGPGAILNLESTFPDEITDIKWRRYDASGAIENLDQFKDLKEITVFEDGVYEASVFSIIPEIGKDCELGRNSMELYFTLDRVEFTIPDSLSICETFEIIPETTQPLLFELTLPDGSLVKKNAGEAFTLDQNGTYSLYGYDPEVSSPNCPEIKEFFVQVNQPIPFEPILFSEDCNGQKIYQAKLTGASADDALFFWYDENQTIIGTEEFLTFNGESGSYSLLVQPKNSEPCDLEPIEFEVPAPVLDLQVDLIAAPLCPDALDAAISVETDLDKVGLIEWWYTDFNGNQIELVSQKNKPEILATQEGTYEARVFNNVPCLIGTDLVLLTRSMDQVRPIVEESYQVCPRYDIAPTINPGSFASYEWYFGDQLVSTSPTFKPLSVGKFDLVVLSAEGCSYSTSFETIEECELKVVFPNALELGNPDKNFLIYTNYLVDELEVWIYNKWGELIFNCKNTELINEESTCFWDGTLNGEKIPNGAYSIRVNYRNYAKDINEIYLGSIMVIE
ncbi:gliding motility-associated C-terminal domain-containing protein [Algoriphagus aestuarii]|nr:gliding motility-associated C-terminal domain-containing protein [Algoriphagus aestuarii]